MLPKDPYILLSFVNTKLRDEYSDLDALCDGLDADKAELFKRIYNKLPVGGTFVNYDQFCAGQAVMNSWFDGYWENQMMNSGLTDKDIELWKARRKLDRECSVEQECEMLRQSGFNAVKCVYSYQKFSVIVAVK